MSAPAASLLIRRLATSAPVAVPVARVSAGSASLLLRRRAVAAVVPVSQSPAPAETVFSLFAAPDPDASVLVAF
jgi:hypothetical protein